MMPFIHYVYQFIIVNNFCDFNEKSRRNYGAQKSSLEKETQL